MSSMVVGSKTATRITGLAGQIAVAFAIAAGSLAGAIVSPPSDAVAATPDSCPGIVLLGARGSGEKANAVNGFGATVGTFAKHVEKRLDDTSVRRLAVGYGAASVNILVPSRAEAGLLTFGVFGPGAPELKASQAAAAAASYKVQRLDRYTASINEGVRRAQEQLVTFHADCPETAYILAGFSQGAMVMHQTLLRLADEKRQGILDRIIATVLIADGDRVKNTAAIQVGSASGDAQGIRSALSFQERDSRPRQDMVVYDVCVKNDLVCDFSLLRVVKPSAAATRAAVARSAEIHGSTYRATDNPLLAEVARAIADQRR